MPGHPEELANDNATVLPLPSTGFDLAEYDGGNVPSRFDYSVTGSSAASDFATGLPVNQGRAFDAKPKELQGGNDEKQARELGSQAIISLDQGNWLGQRTASGTTNHGLTVFRAGAPTDDGRLPMVMARNTAFADMWTQLDDGMGVKLDSASPLGYGGILYDAPIPNGFASPGGSTPALPDQELALVNTYRIPPTPWDEYNYIGGPLDG